MDENLFLTASESRFGSDLMLATIVSADSSAGTAQIQMDGTSGSSGKAYKALRSAWPLAAGDRVVLMKQSGTYVILGKIGAAAALPINLGGTGQTTVTQETTVGNVLSAATGWNVTSVNYLQWGKLAMLNVWATTTAQIAANTTTAVANLGSGKIPAAHSPVQVWLSTTNRAVIQTDGVLSIRGSSAIASGEDFTFMAVYLLA